MVRCLFLCIRIEGFEFGDGHLLVCGHSENLRSVVLIAESIKSYHFCWELLWFSIV